MSGGPFAVRTQGLCKFYGTTEAVAGLDLTVPAGSLFGFLGPNGAGKTTTIGVLCTLLRPTAGRAEVAGFDVTHQPHQVRRRIGLVFQESTLDEDLSARENLRFQAGLFGLGRRRTAVVVEEMLELVGLADRGDVPVLLFSGGMRRRLEIARGLLHTPQVLFLDEPTTGLDPQTRTAIWEHLHRLRREHDLTVFLTTHHLEEAEHCGEIAIMDGGAVVAQGAPARLKAVVGDDRVTVRTEDDAAAAEQLRARCHVRAETTEEGLRIHVPDGAGFVPRLVGALDVAVLSVTVVPPSLDDVFLHHTGRTIRESDVGPLTLDALVRS